MERRGYMKKKKKLFDCVEMKYKIQKELYKELEGLSLEERVELLEKRLSQSKILSRFIDKTENFRKTPFAV